MAALTTPVHGLPYPQESDRADVPFDIQALAQRLDVVLGAVGVPTGGGIDWFAPTPPAGFLLCDGSAISRTAYAALFAIIGTTWGVGDGVATFNLPDTRGRVVVGVMPGGNAEVNALGNNDGTPATARRIRHAHTNGLSLPAHGHGVGDPGHAHQQMGWTRTVELAGTIAGGQGQFLNDPYQGAYGAAPSNTNGAGTGISVGNPTSYPAINGTIGVTGGTADGPSFVVTAKAIKT